ncbi:MAG: DUF1810 domain-containing protein [Prevotellaceae bacterium]|jgi:uncharacterized protein (DUF1810 family)|nr:DUF1810 domain-containing protein [Prevotellaceae bacterium]
MKNKLDKFLEAQKEKYSIALSEIKNGEKESHWMWYIFPQVIGLGRSEISKYYAIKDINEAKMYLDDDTLGTRLIEISNELLKLDNNDAYSIFGFPDNLKLQSSMTLFSQTENTNQVFKQVLNKFFDGKFDNKTLQILNE